MIGIVNYNMGNITNVANAIKLLGCRSQLISSPDEFENVKKVILPGVGAFGSMMHYLANYGLIGPLKDWISQDKPFYGICLGYQALFSNSEESKAIEGLGVFSGKVKRIEAKKVPHIGWNIVNPIKQSEVFSRDYFYFVHSFVPQVENEDIIATTTQYCNEMVSAIQCGNLFASQFHPERSGREGLALLKRWLEC